MHIMSNNLSVAKTYGIKTDADAGMNSYSIEFRRSANIFHSKYH